MELRSLVLAVVEARQQEAHLRDELDAAKGRTAEAERVLMDAMEADGLKTVNADGVGRATVKSPRLYARYDVADTDKAMDWLRSQGHGDAIRPAVHHSTFSGIVQDVLSNGGIPPPFVKLSYVPSLAIQREVTHA